MFKNKREVFVTPDEMNEHLEYVHLNRNIIYDKAPDRNIGLNAYIENKQVKFTLTYRFGSKVTTYITRKDDQRVDQSITGTEAYRILAHYYTVPVMDKIEEIGSASPLLWKNPKYEGQWVEAIEYDLNSAYSFAMLQPIPDTTVEPKIKAIKEGKEVGFIETYDDKGEMHLKALFKGFSCTVFPLIESPFIKFVNNWYKRKKNAKTPEEKAKAKQVLNFSVGALQNKNPYIRATIITRCNDYIRGFINEDTLYCNTDSIVSLKPIQGLNIGNEIGQFKIAHQGYFAFVGFNYQWQNEAPHTRGVSKSWFDKDYDIIHNNKAIVGNKYEYIDNKLQEVQYENQEK